MKQTKYTGYLGLFALVWGMSLSSYGKAPSPESMSQRSDVDVIQALGARNRQEASEAQKEVMTRGERMIPLLLQNKGDQRPYEGGGLGKETAAWAFVIPKEGKPLRKSDPPVITVEIASLYLISAIYYGRLDFAEGPVLVNRTKSAGERKLLNNDNRQMKRVYDAYADWVKKAKAEGLDALRQRNEPPLTGTRFGWW